MKDNKKHIDQLFSEKLKNISPAVGDADWSAILTKMPPPAKSKKRYWWWLLLLIPVAISAYLIQTNSPISAVNQNEITKNIDSKSLDHSQSSKETSNFNNSPVSIPKENSLGADVTKDIPSTTSKKTGQKAENHLSKFQKANANQIESEIDQSNTNQISTKDDASLVHRNLENLYWNLLPKAVKLAVSGNELEYPPMEKLSFIVDPVLPKPLFDNKKPNVIKPSRFVLSPYIALNRYTSSFKSSDDILFKYRNNLESPVILPDLGIKIENATGKLIINSGLIQSCKGQQINGLIRYMVYDSFPHLDPQGNIIGYFRLNYRDTTSLTKVTNKYSYLEIPLNIGWKQPLGGRQSLTTTIGTTLSVLTSSKGLNIAGNYGLHDVNDNSLFAYKKMMTSVQADLRYQYSLNNKLSLGVGLQYRKGLTNLYKDNSGFNQKFDNMGINMSFLIKL